MRKIRRKRNAMRAAAALSISALAIMPIFANGWQHNNTGWWFGTNDTNTTWHANGWQWLDGNNDGIAECYYFDQNGYMLANGTTPDGYMVNADGQWVVNGAIQKKSVGTSTPNEQNGSRLRQTVSGSGRMQTEPSEQMAGTGLTETAMALLNAIISMQTDLWSQTEIHRMAIR